MGLISFLLNIVYSLLLVPLFLVYWGDEKYGYFLALYAFIQLMRTLDTGHQIYIGNEFNKHYHKDPNKAYEVLSGSMGVALFLGFLECMAFVVFWYSGLMDRLIDFNHHEHPELFVGILAMMVMWWAVGSAGGILARIILAKGYYSESVLFAILIKFVETIMLVLGIFARLTVSTTFILIAVSTIIYSIVVFRWTAQVMPEYYPWWKGFRLKTGFQNFSKSTILTINGFLDQMNTNGILFLISKFITASIIPVFTTVRTLTNTMTMLTNLFVQPLVPEMIRFESEGKKENIWKIIEVNWLVSGSLISVAYLILIPVADSLFTIWTKGHIEFNKPLFYLLSLSVLAINFGRSLTSYLIGINDLKRMSVLSITRFVLIFGVSFTLIHSLGLTAIGIGILAAELICSVLLPVIFVHSHLSRYQFDFAKLLLALLPLPLFGGALAICHFYPSATWWLCGAAGIVLLWTYLLFWRSLEEQIKLRLIHFARKGLRKLYAF